MDNLSNITNWKDRSTCVLFGDGGAAAVLGEGDDLLAIHLTAAGNDEVLRIPHGENSSPFYEHKPEPALLQMMGNDVYKFAVTAMPEGIRTVLKKLVFNRVMLIGLFLIRLISELLIQPQQSLIFQEKDFSAISITMAILLQEVFLLLSTKQVRLDFSRRVI